MTETPVTILTGFLGAGKTTLLNHILNGSHGLKVAVLVNDFGAINIDSQLVVDVGAEDTIELSNGCICCTIRGDLVQALVNLLKRSDPPEYIIIEASGVSDPLEIAMTFRTTDLQPLISIDGILTVIDADQVLSLEKENEVLAVLQIGAADIVVLNKVDLVSESDLEKVRQWVRSIIKNARILETTYGQVPLELILGVGMYDPTREAHTSKEIHVHEVGNPAQHHHEHADHSIIFSTWHWESNQPLSLKALRKTVERLPVGVYRAKGIVYFADDPARTGILQVVGKRASINWGNPWGATTPHSQIVIIGEHGSVNPAELQNQFDHCIRKSKSSSQGITGNIVNWLRGSK